jgi:Na+-driven multidrug efflux pump
MALAESGANFTQGNLFRHVSVMSLTSSIGLMAIFAVDLLDIVFISMLGRDELAAAAGYAGVIMFFASAINIGLSIAAGALVARSLGRNNSVDAREFASSSAVFAVAVGILLALVTLPNIDFFLGLTGANGAVAEMAATYLWIILPTTFLSGLAMVAVAVLRAYGDARGAMYPALLGAGVNAVFDPILIFGLGLNLEGAALATVLARLATMMLAMGLAMHRYHAFSRPRPQCVARDFRETATIALPAVLGTVAVPGPVQHRRDRMARRHHPGR